MNLLKRSTLALAAVAGLVFASPLLAQSKDLARLHGHVTNPAGQPITKGTVSLTQDVEGRDKLTFKYNFPLDEQGNYNGTGIMPGDWHVYVVVEDKHPDEQDVKLALGEDKTLDFDMTRPEYLAKMSPEDRKNLEEFKKKNSEAVNANKVIAGLNATLKRVREDIAAARPTSADVSKDVADMKAATDAKPDEGLLWIQYGDALQAQGDHLAAEDRKQKKSPQSDDAVTKLWNDAADSYKKGADLNAASKKPVVADQAAAWNGAGNAFAKLGKLSDAQAAFDKSAALNPGGAGMAYANEAAVLFNANQFDGALQAADKSIAADPTRPDPYFVKGQVLIQKATFDAKTNKIIPPPGCVEAYQKYLELAPDGVHATAVKEVLQGLGQSVETKYRSGKK